VQSAQRWSSAAASASQQRRQKANDLARAAVGCNDWFGGLAAVARVLPVSADHSGTEPRGTTGVWRNHTNMQSRLHNGRSVESPAARNHTCTTSVRWNHLPHTITPDMTGNPHHERSNHACTTSVPHNGLPNHTGTTSYQHHGRSYHASITRTGTTGTGTTGVEESPLIDIK